MIMNMHGHRRFIQQLDKAIIKEVIFINELRNIIIKYIITTLNY